MTNHDRIIAKSPSFGPFGFGLVPFPLGDADCILTLNGRTAIWAGLRALGFPAGSRVLVPAWHCGTEIDAILAVGGVPVPYRLRPDLSADMDDIRRLLVQGAGAVYTIHYFGVAQPMAELSALAREFGALLVEDLALGLYSKQPDGTSLGTMGDMAIFSLVKTLAVPDGGALWLARGRMIDRLRAPPLRQTLAALRSLYANAGRRSVRDRNAGQNQTALDRWNDEHCATGQGPHFRASAAARWLVAASDHIRVAETRRQNFRALVSALPASGNVRPLIQDLPEGACPAFFPVIAEDTDRLFAALIAARVEPVRFWRRFHPAVDLSDFPEVHRLKRQVIRLPIHTGVDATAIARIARACTSVA